MRRASFRQTSLLGLSFAAFFAAFLLLVSGASAHTTPGGFTLHQLCRAADVVAVARLIDVAKEPIASEPTLSAVAEIEELLREGNQKKGKILFLAHRHGDDTFVPGEQLLLFLKRREKLTKDDKILFEAVDTITDRIVLSPATRDTWIGAVRAYLELGRGPRAETDPAALSRVTLAMLGSGQLAIGSLALRDLTLSGAQITIGQADVPAMVALVESPKRAVSFRTGLVAELERRKLVEVGPIWVKLLKNAAPEDRAELIRAAATRAFVPQVTEAILPFVEDQTPDTANAAVRALGIAGNEKAVPALEKAASGEPQERRLVALGSLRRIGTKEARRALTQIASTHADAETRNAATTELNLMGNAPVEAEATSAQAATSRIRPWMVLLALAVVGWLGYWLVGRGKSK